MQPTTPQSSGTERPEEQEQPAPYIPPHALNPQPAVLPTPVTPGGLAAPVVGTGGQSHADHNTPAPMASPQPATHGTAPHPGYAPDSVSWQASEYLQRNKDIIWIVLFSIVSLAFLALAFWLQSWSFIAMVLAGTAAIAFYAFRKPRVLNYGIDHDGITVGEKDYEFTDFRAFGVRDEEAFYSVMLIPVKRLMPAVRMYFAEENGEDIVDILSEHLPMEELPPDMFENFMRRLHF